MAETVQVSKQFTVKLFEVGKAAVIAGITAALTLLATSIDAGHLPELAQIKQAGMVGVVTMLGAIIRYFVNPTTTVIKGQVDTAESVIVTKDTVSNGATN